LSGCGGAIAQVQQFRPADAKAPLDEILTNTLAATRASGTPVDVDGWSVAGAPPQCAVGFRYRQNGAPINLRWQVDGVTGQVKPADEVTRQTSGF